LLVRATYNGVVLRAHSVCGESRIQRNASAEVATVIYELGFQSIGAYELFSASQYPERNV